MSPPTNPWNRIFELQGRVFNEPHEALPRIAQMLNDRGANRVLDLGSGSGRHSVYLAHQGFAVYGMDISPRGIELTRKWLGEEDLNADLRVANMLDSLPYDDAFFDAVISVQVIHHARIAKIRSVIKEIKRVLRVGGFVFVTVTRLHGHTGNLEEIEPNTYIPQDGPEKGLPHHRFTKEELEQVFGEFENIKTFIDKTNHYCLSALKPRR